MNGEDNLSQVANEYGLELTPRLGNIPALPTGINETYEFLKAKIPKTNVALDAGACGQAEGIVARSFSRNAIAKLRFTDYQRHINRAG